MRQEDEPGDSESSPYENIGIDLGAGSSSDDDNARREDDEFNSGKIEKDTQEGLIEANERRDEHTREQFHWLFLLGLRVVGLSLISVFVIRILHVGMPEHWYWLSEKSIQDIDRMFFSGAAGALIIKRLEHVLKGKPKQ